MSKTKLLTIAVLILLLINIITITFFISKRSKAHGNMKNSPKEIVINKLHFNEKQISEYDKLIKEHQVEINKYDNDLKKCKNNLFLLLSETTNKQKTDSLFSKIAEIQKNIELTHYNHFLQIKALCNDKQLNDFNLLTAELSKIFAPKPMMKGELHK